MGVMVSAMSKGLRIRDLAGVLRGPFTVDFEPGSCAVISGPSGSGKSVFLRMVADLDPNTGTVLLDGQDRAATSAPRWRRLVTYVPAEAGWWAEDVADHMGDREAARVLFPALGLDPVLLDAAVSRLSSGERQRAALVRAMVGRPRFLLLDEPTSALDTASKLLVESALSRTKADGMGLVVVSHDAEQARRIGDRAFIMTPLGLSEILP